MTTCRVFCNAHSLTVDYTLSNELNAHERELTSLAKRKSPRRLSRESEQIQFDECTTVNESERYLAVERKQVFEYSSLSVNSLVKN